MKKKVTALMLALMLFTLVPANRAKAEDDTVGYPKVIITEYSTPDDMKEGEDTVLTITIKNTSTKTDVKDILVSLSSASSTIMPVEGKSNQAYIAEIKKGASYDLELPVIIDSAGNKYKYAQANISIIYSAENNVSFSNSVTLSIPFEHISSLMVNNIYMAQTAVAGTSSLANIAYTNNGGTDIETVTLYVEGDGFNGKYSLPAVKAGGSNYADVYLLFTEPGNYNVSTRIVFTDEIGNSFEMKGGSHAISVAPMPTQAPAQTEEPAPGGMDMYKIFLYIAIIAVLGTVITIVVRKSK